MSSSINGKKILFAGNSLTFYGRVVIEKNGRPTDEKGIFETLCESFGDKVSVTNFTFGGAGFIDGRKSPLADGFPEDSAQYGIYQLMLAYHPDCYANADGKPMDDFYAQDYVVLQQRGAAIAESYEQAKKIAALFPPTTRFAFLVTHYDARYSTYVSEKESLRDGWIIINSGELVRDLYEHTIEPLRYDYKKADFVITKDNVHPNYLTGYLKALGTYCALTGKSGVGADYSFISRSTELYNSPEDTQFPAVLEDTEEMLRLQKLLDEYLKKANS